MHNIDDFRAGSVGIIKVEVLDMNEEVTKKKRSGRHLTAQEQLDRIAEQQKALAARARTIRARESTKERKLRAHRLIQIGGVVEAVFGAAIEGEKMLKALEDFLREQDRRGNYFSKPLHEADNLQRRQAAAAETLPTDESGSSEPA